MRVPETFLWGGATASFQYEGGYLEGGRGLSAHDFETDGSVEHPRCNTYRLPDGTTGEARSSFFHPDSFPDGAEACLLDGYYYPSHQAVDFYHHWKEDLASLSTGEMKKRYGFVYVDMDDKGNGTLERKKKKSYDWMKAVIATHGESIGDA